MRNRLRVLLWILKIDAKVGKWYIVWRIFHGVVQGIIPLLTAFLGARLLVQVTQVASGNLQVSAVVITAVYILGLTVTEKIIFEIGSLIDQKLRNKSLIMVNEIMFQKIYELSQVQFEEESFNTKLARSRDTLYSIQRYTTDLTYAFSDIMRLTGALIALTAVSPLVALVIIIAILPITLVNIRQNKRFEKVYDKAERYDRIAFRTRWMLIDPMYMTEVRLANSFKQLFDVFRKNMTKAHDIEFTERKKQSIMQFALAPIEPLVEFGVFIYFLSKLAAGLIGLESFLFIRSIVTQASVSLSSSVRQFDSLHAMTLDLENFLYIFNTPSSFPNGEHTVTEPLTIEFKDVWFRYNDESEYVLKGVSFILQQDSKLALVGENGAGKSTLIKLILRQYAPTKGAIFVNNMDIKEIDFESYYQHVANLSQTYWLVPHLTIRENLQLGLSGEEIDTARLRQALEMADANAFVEKTEHKLEERLDASFKDGKNFSGGQMQRLAIARALVRQAPLLILDEPTSAIDAKAEHKIFNSIFNSRKTGATLIVSHRFSTIRKADGIIVLENGKIQAYGTHQELIKHGGLYKDMFDKQAEGYK